MHKIITSAGVGLIAILSASAVCAADQKVRQSIVKVPAVVAAPSWTGFYFGGHVGYLWGRTRVEENGVLTESGAPTNGVVGGVLGGYNWQSGAYVYGLEADFGWSNAHGNGIAAVSTFIETPNQYDIRWTSHVRGRFGFLYDSITLFYLAGGLSLADFKFTEGADIAVTIVNQGAVFAGGSIGGGVERILTSWVRGRIEYLYDDFGSKTYVTAPDDTYNIHVTGHTVRGALTVNFP